eukprot:4162793-Amphidinium_carterae.1
MTFYYKELVCAVTCQATVCVGTAYTSSGRGWECTSNKMHRSPTNTNAQHEFLVVERDRPPISPICVTGSNTRKTKLTTITL